MTAVRPIELSLTVRQACYDNVNKGNRCACCLDIICYVFREYVPIIGQFYASFIILISDSHNAADTPKSIYDRDSVFRVELDSIPRARAFVRLVKVIVCPTIPAVVLVNCRIIVSSVTFQHIVEQLIN